jgi:eukaryotic-like serine/threonine-protein kinase
MASHFEGSPKEGLSTPKPYSPSRDEVVRALASSGAGSYEAIGALGRDRLGRGVHLASERASGRLVAIRSRWTEQTPQALDRASIDVLYELDASVPTVGSACHHCGAALPGWDRVCSACGGDLVGIVPGDPSEMSRDELEQGVSRAVAGTHEVIGEMARVDRGGVVYFAREIASGHLTAIWPFKDTAGYGLAISRPVPSTSTGAARSGATPDLGGVPPAREPNEPARLFAGPDPEAPAPASLGSRSPVQGPSGPQPPEVHRVCPHCGATYERALKFCPLDGTPLRAPATTDLVGHLLAGRYAVLRKLGEGGMGQVYLAEHVKMGRQCAIKVIRPGLMNDVQAINRFAREAANASRITHPNIATIYDYGEADGGLVYLAMEFVDGPTLSTVLAQEGALPPARAVEIARQVAEALSAAHEFGIIHRDLKPDNIMLARTRDRREVVKVVDFGIAKATEGSRQQLTQTGVVIGTPEYMSPEQLVGDPADGRTDIYSLGCVLYKMLVGEAAFAGPSGEASVNRRLTEAPPHPRKLKPGVPKALDELTVKALARRPGERFQTAAELRDALQASLTSAAGGRFQLPSFQWRKGTTAPPQPVLTPPSTPPSTPPATPPSTPKATSQASPLPLLAPPSGAVRSAEARPMEPSAGQVRGPNEHVERRTPPSGQASERAGTPNPAPRSASGERQAPPAPGAAGVPAALPDPVPRPSSDELTDDELMESEIARDPATPATPATPWIVNVPPRRPAPPPGPGSGRIVAFVMAAAVIVGTLAVAGPRVLRKDRAGPPVIPADSVGPNVAGPSPVDSTANPSATSQDSSPPGSPESAKTGATTGKKLSPVDSSPQVISQPPADSSRRPKIPSARDTIGTLRIGSELPPGATITVDGNEVRLGPSNAIQLALGDHRVEVGAPGYQPVTLRITIEPGSPQRWDPVLKPASAPSGAEEPSRDPSADSAAVESTGQDSLPQASPPDASGAPTEADTVPADTPPAGEASADAAIAAIRGVVAGYTRGIEERSLAAMRQYWPAMPPQRQGAWRSFFTDARDVLDAEIEVTRTDIAPSGTSAQAVLDGSISFEDQQGAVHTATYDARATLRRLSGRWRFVDMAETRTEEP